MEINLTQLTNEELENLYQNLREEWKNRLQKYSPDLQTDMAWFNLMDAFYDFMEIDEKIYIEENGKEKGWDKGITVSDENNQIIAVLTKNTKLDVVGWFDNGTYFG